MRAQSVRSPIKGNPLHNPGQSLEDEIQRIGDDLMTGSWILAVSFTGMAAVEWVRFFRDVPPNPALVTLIAVSLWVYTGYRIYRTRNKLRTLKQGRDGEKAVGQYLDRFVGMGAHVFHDVPAPGFNVDHVIIAPQGVYVIETKTLSKPMRGKA